VRGRTRIGIFAIKDIAFGEALSYDYRFDTNVRTPFRPFLEVSIERLRAVPVHYSNPPRFALAPPRRPSLAVSGGGRVQVLLRVRELPRHHGPQEEDRRGRHHQGGTVSRHLRREGAAPPSMPTPFYHTPLTRVITRAPRTATRPHAHTRAASPRQTRNGAPPSSPAPT